MSYTVATLLDKVRILLADNDAVTRWTDAELISFLNDGIKEVIVQKPDANVQFVVLTTTTGVAQTITGYLLLDVVANCNADASILYDSIRRVKKVTLDFTNPTWTSVSKTLTSKFYMYETEDSSIFYVYPPSTGGSYIYTKQSVFPADLTTTAQTVGLDEAFQQALIYYCCYKAFLQDTDQVNQQKASTFATLFSNQLAGNDQAEQREDQKNAS